MNTNHPVSSTNRYDLEPLTGENPSVLQNLLQKPGRVLHRLGEPNARTASRTLLLSSIICLAIFGVLLGTFSGHTQLWAAPVKVLLGVLGSGLICFPSLYIFCCLAGLEQPPMRILGTLLAGLCLTSLLLLGFSPVVLVFSQSSNSSVFLGVIGIIFYLISLAFGGKLLLEGAARLGAETPVHLRVWLGIFALVSLQMTSTLRPILGQADTFLPQEKKFFLQHWFDHASGKPGLDLHTGSRNSLE